MTIKYEHLLGLPFKHGFQDCFELGRKFYLENFNIEVPAFARPDDWWHRGMNLYYDHYRAAGFDLVSDWSWRTLNIADVLLMAIKTEHPCHCAVYLGQGKILHHFYNRFSETVSIKGIWRNSTVAVLRHKDLKNYKPEETPIDYMTMISPSLRKRLEEAAK